MINYDEKDKLSMMKFFKKLYLKSVDNISVNPFELSDEEDYDHGKGGRAVSAASSKVNPYKAKKSFGQMMLVE